MTAYMEAPHETLRQGDIILAPTAILLAEAEAGRIEEIPDAPAMLGERVPALTWNLPDEALAPAVAVETLWSPVLVLSRDCELEKDFNERVRELIAGGMPEEQAIAEASADPTLDPLAVVAPLQPYSDFPERRHAGMRAGDRIGTFPIDTLPVDGGDYVVDLFRPATVSVRLLPQAAKVASLAPPSVFELRYKLSEAYASRDLAVLAELEAMIGHTILRVEALPKARRKTALVLHLDGGDSIHMEIKRPRDELPGEIARKATMQ